MCEIRVDDNLMGTVHRVIFYFLIRQVMLLSRSCKHEVRKDGNHRSIDHSGKSHNYIWGCYDDWSVGKRGVESKNESKSYRSSDQTSNVKEDTLFERQLSSVIENPADRVQQSDYSEISSHCDDKYLHNHELDWPILVIIPNTCDTYVHKHKGLCKES